MLPTRDQSQDKRLTQTESEGLEKNFPSKRTGKKSRDSNIHIIQNRLPKKGHKERPRRSLHNTQRKNPPRSHKHCQYICTQHRSTPIKTILGDFKKYVDNIITVGDFKTPLSKMGKSSKQSINKDTVALNNTLDEMDLTDIYIETFIPKKQNTHSFNVHETFSKVDHMKGNKTSFNKFKKIDIISSIFSDHKGLKQDTNLKEKTTKH